MWGWGRREPVEGPKLTGTITINEEALGRMLARMDAARRVEATRIEVETQERILRAFAEGGPRRALGPSSDKGSFLHRLRFPGLYRDTRP